MFTRSRVKVALAQYVVAKLLTDSEKNGEENRKLQTEHFKLAPSLPTYVRVTPEGKVVKVLAGWEPDEEKFLEFLGK